MRRLPLDILAIDSTHSHPYQESLLLALIRYEHGMNWLWREISRIQSTLQVTPAGGRHFIFEPNQTLQMVVLGELAWSQEAWPCHRPSDIFSQASLAEHM